MKGSTKRQAGSALLTVLGIVAVVSIVCGMLSLTASNQMRASQITRDMLKARMIAESGLNKAYCQVRDNFSLAKSYALTETFGGGSFTVKAAELSDAVAKRAQLISVGTCGLGKATVAVDLENRTSIPSDGDTEIFYPLSFDLLTGGVLDINGNFYAGVNSIHANGNVDLGGSSSVGGGTISSAGSVTWKKAPEDVTLLSDQAAQEIFPDALQTVIDALKAYAEANDAVYASGADIPLDPPGGVAYCTGSDSGWSGEGSGCFIFEGTFSSKHLDLSSVDGFPALIVMSPNSIQLNAGTTINGAVLLPTSSLKINGHTVIYGPVLVGQSVTGNGTADLYAGSSGQGFSVPTQEETTDNVVVTAWH